MIFEILYVSVTPNKEDKADGGEETEKPAVPPKKKAAKPAKGAAASKAVEKPAKTMAPKKAGKLH